MSQELAAVEMAKVIAGKEEWVRPKGDQWSKEAKEASDREYFVALYRECLEKIKASGK